MQSVLDLKQQQATQDRTALLSEYRKILDRWEKPANGDADRLAEIQQGLELSDSEVEQDYFALCELRKTRAAMLGEAKLSDMQSRHDEGVAAVKERTREIMREAIEVMLDDPRSLFQAADALIVGFVIDHAEKRNAWFNEMREVLMTKLAALNCEITNARNQEAERKQVLDRIHNDHPRLF